MKPLFFLLFYSLFVIQGFAQFDNDLGITMAGYQPPWEYVDGSSFRDLEYSIYPITQLREFNFYTQVYNYGDQIQESVVLQVEINGPSAFNQILLSDFVSISPGSSFVFELEPWMPPSQLGAYTIDFTIISEFDDDFPENNSFQKTFNVSEVDIIQNQPYYLTGEQYARDLGATSGAFNDFYNDYKIGTVFYMENPATVHGLGVALAPGTDEGAIFTMGLYSFPDLNFVAETDLMTVSNLSFLNDFGDNYFLWAPLVSQVNLIAGMNYIVVVHVFWTDYDVVVSSSGYSPDYSSFFSQGSEATWYYTNQTPMVRMAIWEGPSIFGCTDPTALNYNPQATIDNGSCEYQNPFECELSYEMFLDTIGGDVIWVVLDYGSGGNNAFHWDFGDGNESFESYPSHTYTEDGDYLVCVTLIVTDDLGDELCTDQFCDIISSNFLSGLTINIVNPTWLLVSEMKQSNSFTFFPNPTTDLLNVLFSGSLPKSPTIQFYDISGRLLQFGIIPILNQGQQLVFDISKLPAGIYFVSIESSTGRETHKLLKQ